MICSNIYPGTPRSKKPEQKLFDYFPTPKSVFPNKCGLRSDSIFDNEGEDIHFRVVHGSKAEPGQYPWQVR